MISRQTIFSLLLALLVGVGIFAWNEAKRDDCDRAGPDRGAMQVPVGQSGRKVLLVRCNDWLPRQPVKVQAWCFLDVALGVVFGMSLLADVARGNRERSAWLRRNL